jgi:hypothetical protein
VLQWMLAEQNETMDDECETQRNVMVDLGEHKQDAKYN